MVALNPQLTQSVVDCDSPEGAPPGRLEQLLSRFAPGIPSLAASQVRSPNDRMWLKIRLKPPLIWLRVRSEKMWVSDNETLRPWLVIFWVLAKALGSANPGEPPGTKLVA